ncbi:hypothetical protein [Photobacterium lutimaris]|uniref:Uncharacterized protein n=1 Tax=Photobacterium lutimaris TaxID=388278 RepID=A0A2T3J0U2_9GAMM|nr:hypothetical protein [Photobacterium lutimaris]PSU34667.1 hypothetical protein C9I99_06100 [Photobacterium lutimaris]TDR71483.1 hypothetical protein DFP78_11615 [Photobacterium lutimaris]
MSLLDSVGETLGGIWDTASDGGEAWLNSWFDNEAEKVASAAPEENRTPQHKEPAQQPTGQPIYTSGVSNTALMLMGGGIAALALVLLLRGK